MHLVVVQAVQEHQEYRHKLGIHKPDQADRYDGKGEVFHNKVTEGFMDAWENLITGPWKGHQITFCDHVIDFNRAAEENVSTLMDKVSSLIMKQQFDSLVTLLRDRGYTVDLTPHSSGGWAYVYGKGIVAGFSVGLKDVHRYCDHAIAADNVGCFDKWRKCPLVMTFPLDEQKLLGHLEWLASEEGYKHSNNLDYLDKEVLPMERI